MKAETTAFLRRDFAALRANWIDTPQSRFLIQWPGVGSAVYCGIDEIVAMLSTSVAGFPPVENPEGAVVWRNLSIAVTADMAWASYDQVSRNNDPDLVLSGIQHELKIFHRVAGVWKIACVVVMAPTLQHLSDPMIEVGADMCVLWMNESGRAILPSHPGLMVGRNNRLRVRSRSHAADLETAVAWAHGKRFANPKKTLMGEDRIRAVPLGEDDEGAPLFCWVLIEDARVLVAFDQRGGDAARIERARQVFGLSPVQVRLARLIMQGLDLRPAAERLGVSVNTARTQLNRMFDKTGVHNQAALVRRLVNMRVPTKG